MPCTLCHRDMDFSEMNNCYPWGFKALARQCVEFYQRKIDGSKSSAVVNPFSRCIYCPKCKSEFFGLIENTSVNTDAIKFIQEHVHKCK